MRKKTAAPKPARPKIRKALLDDHEMVNQVWGLINRHSSSYDIDIPALVEELSSKGQQTEILVALLEVADEIMRYHSFAALEKTGILTKGTAECRKQGFEITDGYEIIKAWAQQSEQIMKTLVCFVTEGDEKIRANAAFTFVYMGDHGVDVSQAGISLEYALFDVSPDVRDNACMALGNLAPTENSVHAVLDHLYERNSHLNAIAAETLLIWLNSESNPDYQKRKMVYSGLVEKLRKNVEIPNCGLLPDEFYIKWLKKEVGAEDPLNDN